MKSLALYFTLLFSCSIGFNLNSTAQNKIVGNFYLQQYLEQHGDSEEPVGLFIKGDKKSINSFVSQNDGIYRGSIKGWHYIRIPSNQIENLILSKTAKEVNFRSYKGQPMNDTMRVNNRINQIHAGDSPLDVPLTGQGVIMGFIDTGLDWRHPDFQHPDGSTRILSLWDQTLANNQYTPSEYGYGQHWDSTLINQDIPTNNDQWGHGTTVTGAAAGNGSAVGMYKGVAPDVDIVAVESNFNAPDWLATVVDAVEYIYHIADSIGKPCSINASVGTYLGSHDGLDPYALYIDSLIVSKTGHLFAASAGNTGDEDPYHLHHDVTQDTNYTFFEVNPSYGYVFHELWADTADFNQVYFTMGADKIAPSHSFRGRGEFISVDGHLNMLSYDTIRNTSNDILATIQYWMEARDGQYLVQVYMPSPDSSQYAFRFETFGSGSFDGWSSSIFGLSDMIESPDLIPGFTGMSNYIAPDSLQSMVSSFQCSPNVITVGNYANDSGYVNKNGNWTEAPGEVRGRLAESSSKGPSRLGLVKPEVAATGAVTNSSYPLFRIAIKIANGSDSLLALGGMHFRNGGTSMASPIVAGVGALFLEKCPNATQADFMKAVINNTYQDGFTGTLPNYAYGYGKLDGFATLVDAKFEPPAYNGDAVICNGDSNLITIAENNSTYAWSNGVTNDSVYFTDTTFNYGIATHSSGCKSDSIFVDFSIAAQPVITSGMVDDTICEGETVNIYHAGTFDNLLYDDSETSNPRVFTTSFDGFVIPSDTNNCVGDTINVVITEIPSPDPPTISADVNLLSTPSQNADYQWYLYGAPIAGANDSTHIAVANGYYYVEVSNNSSGCTALSDSLLFDNVGIIESGDWDVRIYPNPTNGNLFVETTSNIEITLFNNLGEIIESKSISSGTHYFNDLATGSYFLKMSDGKNIATRKIVVTN